MSAIEEYVHEVVGRIAPAVPARGRIEADLRTHLAERVAAGASEPEAVARMGPAEEVARAYLDGVELVWARWPRRLGAFLLDVGLGATLLMSLVLVAAYALEPGPEGAPETIELPVGIALGLAAAAVFVLGILYFPVMETLFGQTVGKHVFGTGVAREDGGQIGFGAAILRRIPLLFDFWPFDAAFLFFTRKRQRAFDIVARTVVIEGGRGWRRAWAWTGLAWVAPVLLAIAIQLRVT